MDTYEKKYKELAGKIKKAYLYTQTDSTKAVLEDILPELAESEDERMRQEIIKVFKTLGDGKIPIDIHYADIFTWLEKQEGCECIKKDWLEHIKQSWYKEGFIDGKYSGEKQGEKKHTDNDMVEALRTEYEKGRADAFTEMEKSWSEEDKNFMYDTLSNLTELKDRYGKDYGNVGKCMDWIKSLKQRIGG